VSAVTPAAYKELVILAAPTCSGKTRFLEWLVDGRISGIQLTDPAAYFLESRWSFEPPSAERVILHSALPIAPLVNGEFRGIADDPRLSLTAERVIAITLMVRPEIHAARFRMRSRSSIRCLLHGLRKYLDTRRRLARMRRLCAESANVTGAYDAWFAWADDVCSEHYLVTANDDYEVMGRAHWPRLRQEYW